MSGRNMTGSGIVLDLIRSGRATTRTDLLDGLGWSRVTLSRRLDELIDNRIIIRAGHTASGGGRPREEFEVNPELGLVLAIDIGSSHSRVGITDVVGAVLLEDEADIGLFDGPSEIFSWAEQVFDFLLMKGGWARDRIRGIGVGVPGPVDSTTGYLGSPQLDPRWDNVRVRDYFTTWPDDIVFAVDRDVNILAIGEARYGWPEYRDLVVVKTGIGIGCAFVMDGNVVRGSRGGAGQLSAPLRDRLSEPLKRLETVASGGTIRDRLVRSGAHVRTSADIVALAQDKNSEALALLEDVGEIIGYALADVVGLLNPSAVVIGGNLAQAGERYIGAVRRALFGAAHVYSRQKLVVEPSRLASKAGVRGASALALDALFESERISALTRPRVE
ncbi:ROK family transcriptional regulator [Paramicrobacterium chengjingii]|uniref:ROK family protein n=1 Tax=Paramicrobacterium chengjingii TaxID=2769067 RepID=A0ABX6YH99_9MICO|nr:ROK family protein [Microbacterium chengjingii]QPZ38075.1 ROK family protein [Microbacterium chengjingii]